MSGERIASAEEFANDIGSRTYTGLIPDVKSIIAARVRARDKVMIEAACAAVCRGCRLGVRLFYEPGDTRPWHALRAEKNFSMDDLCFATPIREAMRGLLEQA